MKWILSIIIINKTSMRFAAILSLSAFAAAATTTSDSHPVPDPTKAKTGWTHLPVGSGDTAGSTGIVNISVDGNGGILSIAQSIMVKSAPANSIVQSWVSLAGVGDYDDDMYAIANGTPGPDLKQADLKNTVACGKPRSMSLPGYTTASTSELSTYYCSIQVANKMTYGLGLFT